MRPSDPVAWLTEALRSLEAAAPEGRQRVLEAVAREAGRTASFGALNPETSRLALEVQAQRCGVQTARVLAAFDLGAMETTPAVGTGSDRPGARGGAR